MRSVILALLSLLVMSCGMMIHNADDIINDMRDNRHAEYFNVGSGLLGLGRLISPTLSEAGLGITSVKLLDLSKCSPGVRDKFRKNIQNLYKNRSYEEIITTQQGYDLSDAMVVINGHINLENLERIVNDQSIFNKKF